MDFFSKKTLVEITPLVYIDYLNKLRFKINGVINSKKIVFLNNTKNILPKHLDNRYIEIEIVSSYSNSTIIKKGFIVADYATLEQALSNSKIKGLSSSINDNLYFDKIPLINELGHHDNSICSMIDYVGNYIYQPLTFNDWNKFKLIISLLQNKEKCIKRKYNNHKE